MRKVGLYGNPIIQSRSLANIISDVDSEELGGLLPYIRGAVIIVEEKPNSINTYKIEVTSTFEGTGKHYQVVQEINKKLEDLINKAKRRGLTNMVDLVELMEEESPVSNPYISKLKRTARRFNLNISDFDEVLSPEGNYELEYLYVYQNDKTPLEQVYNDLYVAEKYILMKEIGSYYMDIRSGKVDFTNNCMTVTFQFNEDNTAEFLGDLLSLINGNDLLNACLSNIRITLPTGKEHMCYIFPNMPSSHPEYLQAMLECDYIVYAESEKYLDTNRNCFIKELQEQMVLAPDTKVDYILIKGGDEDDALIAHSLHQSTNIPALKTLVGEIGDLEWESEAEGALDANENNAVHKEFFVNPNGQDSEDVPTLDEDEISFTDEEDAEDDEIEGRRSPVSIDFNMLKKELTEVGLSGFQGMRVRKWGEENVPLSVDIIPASEIDTKILDDYDVAKIKIGDKEVLMHYMDKLDLNQITDEFINIRNEHIEQLRSEISVVRTEFLESNGEVLGDVFTKTKETLMKHYKRCSEREIEESYIKIVLSDICDELYLALRESISNTQFNYDISGKGSNAFVSANFKLGVLVTAYDHLLSESRKYWLRGVEKDLRNPEKPNLPIIQDLLEKIF